MSEKNQDEKQASEILTPEMVEAGVKAVMDRYPTEYGWGPKGISDIEARNLVLSIHHAIVSSAGSKKGQDQ